MTDRFRPDAAARRATAPEAHGQTESPEAALKRLTGLGFDERGPIGHVGRNSIPKSYRGEETNFVD
jgi:hypothetical protein